MPLTFNNLPYLEAFMEGIVQSECLTELKINSKVYHKDTGHGLP